MSNSRTMTWFMWMIASIFYAYQYILRVMPNVMLGDIMQQFHIDAVLLGQFSGVYYLGYVAMHLPLGIMLDRFGPRPVMTGCILMTSFGLLPLIFAENWIYSLMGRALIGMGSSAAILGTFKIIRMTFKEKHFTRMLSFSVTIGLIGAIYGGAPLRYLCTLWGYQSVLQIFAVLGGILALITYLIVPSITQRAQTSIFADLKYVLTHSKVMSLCFFAGLMSGPMEGFADVWGTEFFKQVYGFDCMTASYLPSMIYVGMCFGSPFLSMIAEKTGRYLEVITSAGFIMYVLFTALIMMRLNVSMIVVSFVLVGVCCAYQILAIYQASTYVPEHVAGLTTAIANMIIMSFGYFFHTVIGLVIENFGGATTAKGFMAGTSIIPITLLLGVVGCVLHLFKNRKNINT